MPAWNRTSTATRALLRRLRSERGVVLVEFAIILPVLVLFILGIVYFGRYEDYANQETQLAEEGARMASVDNNPGGSGTLQAYIQGQAQPELQGGSNDVSPARVYIYYPNGSTGNFVGQTVTACVVTTVQYPFFGLSSASQTVAQSATMRIEVAATKWTADAHSTVPSACPQ